MPVSREDETRRDDIYEKRLLLPILLTFANFTVSISSMFITNSKLFVVTDIFKKNVFKNVFSQRTSSTSLACLFSF